MALEDDLETMRLFHEKVDVLRRSDFAMEMFTKNTGVSVKYKKGGALSVEVRGPSEDAINAMVLTLRLAMQDGDRISLNNMAKVMDRYSDRSERVARFLEQRRILNTFLAAETQPVLKVSAVILKNGQILRNVIYGELAHLDDAKRQEMATLRASEIMSAMIDNEFNYIASQVVAMLLFLQVQNEAVYRALTGNELPISWPKVNDTAPQE